MVKKQVIFKYKTIKGPLHKLPAILKLFILILTSFFCMFFSSLWLLIGIFLAVIIAFICKISLREQLTDFKPAVFYIILLYSLSVFSNIFDYWDFLFPLNSFLIFLLIPQIDFIHIIFKFILIIQLSALFFRTTSLIDIKEGLIFPFIGKKIKRKFSFSENISLFLCFIPEIFQTWANINLSWKARAGKNGIKKIKALLFILIILSFEKASLKAKAIEARSIK
ncbi:MAG: energy-coupling factor transporter transmembrane protein EcfT [Treponema sp.]|nr:energy-coupling factor transporter transmembrane protein EcfT [Treponema sp.]MCL2251522.1 energy-coupling factor transporter transmembrane protein EcfT [Treponema sp.]